MVCLLWIAIYLLLFVLVALVSGNNLSACSGAIISGGVVDRKTGISITILGYVAGFMLQGGLLKVGLQTLLPVQSAVLVSIALVIALVVFIVSHMLRVPQSLSITFAMALVGIGLAYGKPLNADYVSGMIGFWILSSLASTVLAMTVMRSLHGFLEKRNVWKSVRNIKLALILISFLTAFVLGANTIGFLFASVYALTDAFYAMVLTIIAIVIGSIFLSKGELKTVGSGILPLRYLNAFISQSASVVVVEIATLFSIPASNTQAFVASLYGAGISYRTRLIRKRPMFSIVLSWAATAAVSLVIGFLATFAIYHL